MTEDNKRHNITLFLQEGDRLARSARLLLDADDFKSAVSRAYYAALNHARALLLSEAVEPKTHHGVMARINVDFVRTGRLAPETARILGALEADRLTADYDPGSVYTREMAEDSIRMATRFAECAREILGTDGYV